jgi:hypothetical protein
MADSSRWRGLARCAIREGFTARVALPAGLAVPAGLPAWPPAAGPPAGRPSASGTAGTRTTGAGAVHARIAGTRTARIWAAGPGPWVALPGTARGTGRGRRAGVPAQGLRGAAVRTAARIGVRTAGGT